jgi:NAD(P)H-hydrate repair Nnr-like enzyme with NAD(P)H-hydrate dehydratase domain
MGRLYKKDSLYIQKSRSFAARAIAKSADLICVLKGHKTVIADTADIYINTSGNPGMATAGAGDVLAGMLAGVLAQKKKIPVFEAVCAAVFLHGRAGDCAAKDLGEAGIIATDIVRHIPQAIRYSARGCA